MLNFGFSTWVFLIVLLCCGFIIGLTAALLIGQKLYEKALQEDKEARADLDTIKNLMSFTRGSLVIHYFEPEEKEEDKKNA